MDKLNWSSDFYSDSFSLHFDNLLNYIDLEKPWTKEKDTFLKSVASLVPILRFSQFIINTINW